MPKSSTTANLKASYISKHLVKGTLLHLPEVALWTACLIDASYLFMFNKL